MRNRVLVLGAILAAMALPATQGWAVTVDHFTDGDFSTALSVPVGGIPPALPMSTGILTQAGSMIGGSRDVVMTITSAGSAISSSDVDNSGGSGSLPHWVQWDEGDQIRGTLSITYGGSGGYIPNVLNDFTDGGANTYFGLRFNNDHPLDVTISVFTGQNGGGETALSASKTYSLAMQVGIFAFIAPFTDFTAITPGLDLTDVDRVVFTFDSTPAPNGGGDYQIDAIMTTVPEPVTMAGLMMGVGSLVGYARKRRKA